jgi:hypothetical protein
MVRTCVSAAIVCALAGTAYSQFGRRTYRDVQDRAPGQTLEHVEFQPVRVVYRTYGGGGSRGYVNPWWAIDYPDAEAHFLPALARLTKLSVSEDSRHIPLTDPELFDHPFLFLQQPGRGRWSPTAEEARALREYLDRGGFLLIDDFHGYYEWQFIQETLNAALPGRTIVEIPEDDPLIHVVYSLEQRLQIPGRRHVYGRGQVQMEGPPHWRAIYDKRARIALAMNFNMDMGDAWEHADDPEYPEEMTSQAYRLGINYVVYSMTH